LIITLWLVLFMTTMVTEELEATVTEPKFTEGSVERARSENGKQQRECNEDRHTYRVCAVAGEPLD
jgi:hypothetical protein